MERLARAVNISRWFRFPQAETEAHFRGFITDADLDLLGTLGVTAVRLAVDPEHILDRAARDRSNPQRLAWLDEAVTRFTRRGLAVVIDFHDEHRLLEAGPAAVDAIDRFWSAFAAHFASNDPDAVLLEVVNEPVFLDAPADWLPIQQRLVATIRAAAPHHTIVTGGVRWSGIEGLLLNEPMDDRNVVYTFHFYEPFLFTHQGAPWSNHPPKDLAGVPYPSSLWSVLPLLSPRDRAGGAALIQYGREGWDRKRIGRRIAAASQWAGRHAVPLWAGEFGAYPAVAPQEDRFRWLRDVRTSLERHGIGWAVWSYDESLGLNRTIDAAGKVTIDWSAAEALGLGTR